jgi:hypothetical protein
MKKADNFNASKWLVENKITTQSKLNEDLTSKIAALPDFETSPDTEEATLIVGNYAVVRYDESDEGGEDMYVVWDNTRDQEEIGSYDDEPEFESADPAEVAAFLNKNKSLNKAITMDPVKSIEDDGFVKLRNKEEYLQAIPKFRNT